MSDTKGKLRRTFDELMGDPRPAIDIRCENRHLGNLIDEHPDEQVKIDLVRLWRDGRISHNEMVDQWPKPERRMHWSLVCWLLFMSVAATLLIEAWIAH